MKRRGLLLATHNKGKLREMSKLLCDLPFEIVDLKAFPSTQPIPETGTTFIENASLKAVGYARQTGLLTVADDSGLEVDALGGAPGVLSARYGGPGAPDAERTRIILAELSSVPAERRTARFVSAIVIADEHGNVINQSSGTCSGRIANAPIGSGGFGYDPVFIPEGYDKTFGQLPLDIKNTISHRARALSATRDFLLSLTVS